MNLKTIGIVIVLTAIFSSCNSDKSLLFVKDSRFFIPPLRVDRSINGNLTYRLYERYFVFNYSQNKSEFDSLSLDLLCRAINDSLLLSYCDFNFQDMGWWFGKYQEGDVLTADFTTLIVEYAWYIEEPNLVRVIKRDKKYEDNFIEFSCNLNPNYEGILGGKD